MADTFPLKLLLLAVSGWVHRHQQDTIAYLVEENRILKEKLGGKCPRLNDDQRRRLAALAKRPWSKDAQSQAILAELQVTDQRHRVRLSLRTLRGQ